MIVIIDSAAWAALGEDIRHFFAYVFGNGDGLALLWAAIFGFVVWLVLQPLRRD